MLFTTPLFWVFFAGAVLGHRILRGDRARRLWLLGCSYVFYAAWDAPTGLKLLPLLVLSGAVDFGVGGALYAGRGPRRALLALSLTVNLGVLALFKYLGFFNAILGEPFALPELVLPLGISFFTFQSMSYSLDAFRGRGQPYESPLDFFLFVAFFPQLIAGPIVRAESFRRELAAKRPAALDSGIRIATVGLVLKVFADNVGVQVDALFANLGGLTALDAVAASVGFGMQIYGDFAGYSLIAIGLARCFGIRLPQNFDLPYLAASPRDFWRRWHITLSSWLRDYLYIPLGGSRSGPARTLLAVMVTMALGGLWHGASWTFVVWGLAHGGLVALDRAVGHRLPAAVLQLLTLGAVFALWVPFRAPDLASSWVLWGRVWSGGGGAHAEALAVYWLAVPFGLYHLGASYQKPEQAILDTPWAGPVLALCWCVCAGLSVGAVDFVYFQF